MSPSLQRILAGPSLALALAACATPPAIDASHPASAAAPEAASPGATVLSRAEKGPLFAPDPSPPAEAHHHHHGGHSDGASLPAAEPSPVSPPAASDASSLPNHDDAAADPVGDVYTCPMHPEVTSSKPGKCPKCGMQLEKRETKHEGHEGHR